MVDLNLCRSPHPDGVHSCEKESGNHVEHSALVPVEGQSHTWIFAHWPNEQFKAPLAKGKSSSTKLTRIVQALKRHEATG